MTPAHVRSEKEEEESRGASGTSDGSPAEESRVDKGGLPGKVAIGEGFRGGVRSIRSVTLSSALAPSFILVVALVGLYHHTGNSSS